MRASFPNPPACSARACAPLPDPRSSPPYSARLRASAGGLHASRAANVSRETSERCGGHSRGHPDSRNPHRSRCDLRSDERSPACVCPHAMPARSRSPRITLGAHRWLAPRVSVHAIHRVGVVGRLGAALGVSWGSPRDTGDVARGVFHVKHCTVVWASTGNMKPAMKPRSPLSPGDCRQAEGRSENRASALGHSQGFADESSANPCACATGTWRDAVPMFHVKRSATQLSDFLGASAASIRDTHAPLDSHTPNGRPTM